MTRVLVIEDSPTQAQEIAAHLSERNIDVMIAKDGPQGLRLAAETQPDVILLDVNLPSMNGFQVCRRIKRDEKTTEIPVIMLTSADSADDAMTGLDAGAVDYIPKDDFAVENLIGTLESLGFLEGS